MTLLGCLVVFYLNSCNCRRGFSGSSVGRNPAANARDMGSTPGLQRSRGEGTSTHSSTAAWEIPWTEEPGRLQSTGSQKSRTQLSNETTQQPFKTGSRFMIHVAWSWPGTLIVTGNEDYAIYLSLNIPSYPCLVSLLIIAGTTGPLDANLILLVSKTYPDLK